MTKQVPYWMLFTREADGRWYAQFGAYSRVEVSQEVYANYRSYKTRDRKIIKLADDSDASYKLAERELNAEQQDEHVWAYCLHFKYGVGE